MTAPRDNVDSPAPQRDQQLSNAREDYREILYANYSSTQVNNQAQDWRALVLDEQRGFRSQILPYLPKSPDIAILELGSGRGTFLEVLQSTGYRNFTGVDRSPEQVAIAAARGISSCCQDDAIGYLQRSTTCFDAIVAIDLLEHFTKHEVVTLLLAAHQKLLPGGLLIIRTPNASAPLGAKRRYDDFTHELSFTPASIRQLLLALGYQNIEVHETPPVGGTIKSWVRRRLWRVAELSARSLLLLESGAWYDGPLTQNLVAVCVRPTIS